MAESGQTERRTLPFDGQFVHAVARGADTSVRLDVSSGEHQEIRVACPFELQRSDGIVHQGDPERAADVAPLLELAGRTVTRADFAADLRVEFDDASVLTVQPHPAYEAWEVHGAGGLLIVASPGGGEAALWSADGEPRVQLSTHQAFTAMRRYLTDYWERGGRQDDDLMSVLSAIDQTLWRDGGRADSAPWSDWLDAVRATLSDDRVERDR